MNKRNIRCVDKVDVNVFGWLVDFCADYLGKIHPVVQKLKIQRLEDFGKYLPGELKAEGLKREAIGALEEGLKRFSLDENINPPLGLKASTEIPKGYVLDTRASYRLTRYDIRRVGEGLVVNGVEIKSSPIGMKILSLKTLFGLYNGFREGETSKQVAKDLGLSNDCVRQHLRKAKILVRRQELR